MAKPHPNIRALCEVHAVDREAPNLRDHDALPHLRQRALDRLRPGPEPELTPRHFAGHLALRRKLLLLLLQMQVQGQTLHLQKNIMDKSTMIILEDVNLLFHLYNQP